MFEACERVLATLEPGDEFRAAFLGLRRGLLLVVGQQVRTEVD
jgi:hypothetical protein